MIQNSIKRKRYEDLILIISFNRRNPPVVFLRKDFPKIYSKFTREHRCRSVISIKLHSNFIEITLWHGYSPVNLLHIFRTPFPKNSSEGLLLIEATFENSPVAANKACSQ